MNGFMYDLVFKPIEKFSLGAFRDDLLSKANGKVLEIGVGTGVNFKHYPSEVSSVIAIDNDPDMLSRVKPDQKKVRIQVEDAQNLSFANEEFDTVVATLVLCSIPDPQKAMHEIYRVLKPGGSFLLMEHVRKNTPIAGFMLDTLTPAWKHIAGGCHLNRDPSATIEALGFKIESYRVVWGGIGKIWSLRK